MATARKPEMGVLMDHTRLIFALSARCGHRPFPRTASAGRTALSAALDQTPAVGRPPAGLCQRACGPAARLAIATVVFVAAGLVGPSGRWVGPTAQAEESVDPSSPDTPHSMPPLMPNLPADPPTADEAEEAGEPLRVRSDWQPLGADEMADLLRETLDAVGASPQSVASATEKFMIAVEQRDVDPLTAWMQAVAEPIRVVSDIFKETLDHPVRLAHSLDPSAPHYASVESMPPTLRAAVRTWIGRELVRDRYFDEALPVFAEVDPELSPDPAALLFYRANCYHALLKPKEALADLRQLLQHEEQLPDRFARVANMMVADLKPLKEDSLDEISRLMTDVTRRLDLGRADEPTQQQEQKIIDKLSKLIEDLEKQQQQQQQQQQSSGSAGGSNSSGGSPMEDSRIAGANGPGDVDRKNIQDESGWGNLPPAERQESLQQISRDLPTHYREAIEAYFRRMATKE